MRPSGSEVQKSLKPLCSTLLRTIIWIIVIIIFDEDNNLLSESETRSGGVAEAPGAARCFVISWIIINYSCANAIVVALRTTAG